MRAVICVVGLSFASFVLLGNHTAPAAELRPLRPRIEAQANDRDEVRLVGVIVAERLAVHARRDGLVLRIPRNGTLVRKGELLGAIDDGDVRERIEIAQVQLRMAEVKLQQAVAAGNAADRAQAEAAVQIARLAVEMLKHQLEDSRIVSPANGTFIAAEAKEGEMAKAGTVLGTVIVKGEPLFEAPVPERLSPRLEPGQKAIVEIVALPEKKYPATIIWVAPEIDPATRTFIIRGQLQEAPDKIKPGMTVNATVILGEKK